MIFEYIGSQRPAGAVVIAWCAVGQADAVHLYAGRVNRYPVRMPFGMKLWQVQGQDLQEFGREALNDPTAALKLGC